MLKKPQIHGKNNQAYLKDGQLFIDNTLIYAKFLLWNLKWSRAKKQTNI